MPSQDLDIGRLIDEQPLTAPQLAIFGLCGLIALLDGLDTTSIGVAAPAMAAELGVPITAFGPVFAVALIGATLGAMTFGPLADRLGRKRLLLAATILFGVFTGLTALCSDLSSLMASRFLAGVGMGGATPCFIALTSEYAPSRRRAAIVSLMWAAFPLGGTLGALLNSAMIDTQGWRMIFYIGGAAPLAVAALLVFWLPESARFLVRRDRPGDHAAVDRILARLFATPQRSGRLVVDEPVAATASLSSLFAQGRAPVTVLLWSVFATTFAVLIVTTLWAPALLKTFGLAPASGAIVVGAFNIGCTVGMAAAGRLLERLGLVRSLAPALFLGGLALAAMGYAGHTLLSAALLAVVIGALIGLGASGVIALSTLIYPTEIRSTGVGWAMAAGRAGQAVAPVLTGGLLARGVDVPMVFAIVGLAPILAAVLVLLLAAQSRDEARRTPQRGIGRAPA